MAGLCQRSADIEECSRSPRVCHHIFDINALMLGRSYCIHDKHSVFYIYGFTPIICVLLYRYIDNVSINPLKDVEKLRNVFITSLTRKILASS